jgi:hypothetical protein
VILVSKTSHELRTVTEIEAHHPPGSAAAVSWASLIFRSSKPFSDIALRFRLNEGADQLFAFWYPRSSLITVCAFRGSLMPQHYTARAAPLPPADSGRPVSKIICTVGLRQALRGVVQEVGRCRRIQIFFCYSWGGRTPTASTDRNWTKQLVN